MVEQPYVFRDWLQVEMIPDDVQVTRVYKARGLVQVSMIQDYRIPNLTLHGQHGN